MLKRIENLPNWCLVNKNPAFYDTESATVLEETSKIYGKMQELVNDYNAFANEVNTKISEFITSTNEDQECFKTEITKIMEDYISMIDEKIKRLDYEVTSQLNELINKAIEEGKLVITTNYDETNENLNIVGGVE